MTPGRLRLRQWERMLVFYLHIAILMALAGLLIAVAIGDIRHLRIPNGLVLAILGLYAPYAASAHMLGIAAGAWWTPLAILAAAFVLGLAIFRTGVMGGGDIKLLIVLAPWAGLALLPAFVIAVALGGGLVAALVLVREHCVRRQRPDGASGALMHAPVPYGVAIAAGGLYVTSQLILNALAR